MVKQYVLVNDEGYIDLWSNSKISNGAGIETNDLYIGLLDCVKVVNGLAVLDKEKQQELTEIKEDVTELEELRQKIDELQAQNNVNEDVMLELADMLLGDSLKGGE